MRSNRSLLLLALSLVLPMEVVAQTSTSAPTFGTGASLSQSVVSSPVATSSRSVTSRPPAPTANSTDTTGTAQDLFLWPPSTGLRQCERVTFAFTKPAVPLTCGIYVTNTSTYLEQVIIAPSYNTLVAGTFSWLVDMPIGLSVNVQVFVTVNGQIQQYTLPAMTVEEGSDNSCFGRNAGQNTQSILSYASSLNSTYSYTASNSAPTQTSSNSGSGLGGGATSTASTPVSGASTPALNSFDSTPAVTPRSTSPNGLSKTFSNIKFNDFVSSGQISPATAVGIAQGGFVNCTEVQAQTLPVAITGVDLLAQARTGTGKTLAFLIPSIERLLRAEQQPQREQISVLILSPTRELAIQIQDSAKVLLAGTPYTCDHVVGGTNMKSEINRLNKQQTDILVATPGRLQDHLENSNLKPKLSSLRVLILDEADRLLEAGFRREFEKIIAFLPDRSRVARQTLLFSATIPQQVHQIASLALLPNHAFVSTIPPEEENTHEHVPQYSVTPPSLYDLFPTTLAVLKNEIKTHGQEAKTMVFFPTARATGLACALFKRAGLQAYGQEIFEIHSRKSQGQRNAAAEAFKAAKSAVLFSSDVTARAKWNGLKDVPIDRSVLATLPFIIAHTILLSTTPSLLQDITRDTAAWIALPLQESTAIAAQVLSLDPNGAAFIAGSYLRLSTNPDDYNCEKLSASDPRALLYTMGGIYGGWTWNWSTRWRKYKTELVAVRLDFISIWPLLLSIDLLRQQTEREPREMVAYFRRLAKSRKLNLELVDNAKDLLKPRLVFPIPGSIGASIGARYGLETLAILAQDAFSSRVNAVREYHRELWDDAKLLTPTLFAAPRCSAQDNKGVNVEVPLACNTLRQMDPCAYFTGQVKSVLSAVGMRSTARMAYSTISIVMPSSGGFGIGQESASGFGDWQASFVSHVRVAITIPSDQDRDFDIRFIPEFNGKELTHLAFTGDDLHYRTYRRWLGKVVRSRDRLDRGIFAPDELEGLLGQERVESLISHADDVIESRAAFKTANRLSDNAGSTGREAISASICYQKSKGQLALVMSIQGRMHPQSDDGKRNVAVSPATFFLNEVEYDKAVIKGKAPAFAPKRNVSHDRPPAISGTVCVQPPHNFNVGNTSFADISNLFATAKASARGATPSDRLITHAANLKAFDSAKTIEKRQIKTKSSKMKEPEEEEEEQEDRKPSTSRSKIQSSQDKKRLKRKAGDVDDVGDSEDDKKQKKKRQN
ncbi:uncharacterized protein JCM15063_005096 [Sporobolomyces koalae]|uniref:uncharacterized protein n=1 Tax=Sporobolomyces koalae TaxID=500713 RepID=UPI00316ED241